MGLLGMFATMTKYLGTKEAALEAGVKHAAATLPPGHPKIAADLKAIEAAQANLATTIHNVQVTLPPPGPLPAGAM